MGPQSAKAAFEDSLSRNSSTPSFDRDRSEYLVEQRIALRSASIEPVEVEAVASKWAQQHVGQDAEVRGYFAVARADEKWLLYSEKEKSFALAAGKANEPLELLGFSSDDALAEWLG